MAAAPDVYHLTDHYVNYPVVLVRLSKIHTGALRDLLGMAWRFVTAKTLGRKRTAGKQKDPRAQGNWRSPNKKTGHGNVPDQGITIPAGSIFNS